MARPLLRYILRVSSPLHRSISFRKILHEPVTICSPLIHPFRLRLNLYTSPQGVWSQQWRSITHGTVKVVISPQGKPKFETHEIDPPKKEKWTTKKRLKLQRKKEKERRKAANRRDPRRLGVKGNKKRKFASAEERIKYKLEQAKIKEALLIERLKRYEVPKAQGPMVEPELLTGEERFYIKKMAQKRSNYVQVGRRGVYGGVILNMHMHWKKHETVEVICKPCKPGEVHEYADELARLSGGIPIQIIGDNTIIFYRGKNYVQPKVMSPVDTLSKKRALEKSKYEESLESVRQFIAISEKELELYNRHVALYGDPSDRDSKSVLDHPKATDEPKVVGSIQDTMSLTARKRLNLSSSSSAVATGFADQQLSDDEEELGGYLDIESEGMLSDFFVTSDESDDEG